MKNIPAKNQNGAPLELPISQIQANPNQPRKSFNDASLQELAQTIKERGVIQPVIVEEMGSGVYFLVAGERRLRASKLAGLTTIKAYIRERTNHNGREILLDAIIENVQREDMNPIDEGLAYQKLLVEHKMGVYKIAKMIGTNSKRIYDRMNLLKLDPRVQELIRTDQFTHDPRVSELLLKITDSEMQVAFVEKAIRGHINNKAIITAATDLFAMLEAEPLDLEKKTESVDVASSPESSVTRAPKYKRKKEYKTPALHLARYLEEDEEKEPKQWPALLQLGKVPPWSQVVQAAQGTCSSCELRDMASNATCGRCPAVVMIEQLMSEVK